MSSIENIVAFAGARQERAATFRSTYLTEPVATTLAAHALSLPAASPARHALRILLDRWHRAPECQPGERPVSVARVRSLLLADGMAPDDVSQVCAVLVRDGREEATRG